MEQTGHLNDDHLQLLNRIHMREQSQLLQLQEAQKHQLLLRQHEQAVMANAITSAALTTGSLPSSLPSVVASNIWHQSLHPYFYRDDSIESICDGATAAVKLNQSAAVKASLREVILNKRQRCGGSTDWQSSPQSSFESQCSPPTRASLSTQNPFPLSQNVTANDFPLRKTLSEPNLKVKSVLKQKVFERRSSPMLKRRLRSYLEKQHQLKLQQQHQQQQQQQQQYQHQVQTTATHMDEAASSFVPITLKYPFSMCTLHTSLPNLPVIPRQKQQLLLGQQHSQLRDDGVEQIVYSNRRRDARQCQRTKSVEMCLDSSKRNVVDSLFKKEDFELRLKEKENIVNREKDGLVAAASTSAATPTLCPSDVDHRQVQSSHSHALLRTRSAPLTLSPSLHSSTSAALVKSQLRQKVMQRSFSEETSSNSESAEIQIEEACDMANSTSICYPPVSVVPCFRHTSAAASSIERTTSSPIMKLPSPIAEERCLDFPASPSGVAPCLAYDNGMLAHHCLCGQNDVHPENPARLQAVLARLTECGLLGRFDRLHSRRATIEELMLVHSEMYTILLGASAAGKAQLDRAFLATFTPCLLPCGGIGIDAETVWNEASTASAARLAVGCVLEVAQRVAQHKSRNGLALVRPPGHHAEPSQAMGFCYFNAVAVAAKSLLQNQLAERVAVLDWDVHHGNGTQQMFYDNPNVLYLSIHRWDEGAFFPGTGSPTEVGKGAGLGRNVNIAWSSRESLGDAEYVAAFRCIVLPILEEFSPDIVLVSAGFDAAGGHSASLGGYDVTPGAFAFMTECLTSMFEGKLVVVMEGGYDLVSLADCVEAVVRVLLGEKSVSFRGQDGWLTESERRRMPIAEASRSMNVVMDAQLPYWRCLLRVNRDDLGRSFDIVNENNDMATSAALTGIANLSMEASI